ncbi:MAG: hypothetical protein IJ174_02710 [Clostridia bacterium]|nr:hypothetical protein [Clostridia bacterium]
MKMDVRPLRVPAFVSSGLAGASWDHRDLRTRSYAPCQGLFAAQVRAVAHLFLFLVAPLPPLIRAAMKAGPGKTGRINRKELNLNECYRKEPVF